MIWDISIALQILSTIKDTLVKPSLLYRKDFRNTARILEKKERCEKRPLYDAMNKYGVENFIVEELEYVKDENILSEREVYWIKELETYGSKGYNATKGGDGT